MLQEAKFGLCRHGIISIFFSEVYEASQFGTQLLLISVCAACSYLDVFLLMKFQDPVCVLRVHIISGMRTCLEVTFGFQSALIAFFRSCVKLTSTLVHLEILVKKNAVGMQIVFALKGWAKGQMRPPERDLDLIKDHISKWPKSEFTIP